MVKKPFERRRLERWVDIRDGCATDEEARRAVAHSKFSRAHWYATQEGDFAPLVALLRDSEWALGQEGLDQEVRNLAADIIEGKYKNPEGRRVDFEKALLREEAAQLYVVLTAHLGVPRKRAVGKLADFYQCRDGTVAEWLSSERKRLGPKNWAYMEEQAGESFRVYRFDFGENQALRELFGVTDNWRVGR